MNKKIKNNESIQPLANLLELGNMGFSALDRIPFIYKVSPKISSLKKQFMKIKKQSLILDLPDHFNELFSEDGWICYGALDTNTLQNSVLLGKNGNFIDAHKLLIESINESVIDSIILKCSCRKHFDSRVDLLELLKIDYLEKRYHACIPLLLALLDGLANDISAHVGFFAQKSDLELFDSVTSHESGLPFLQKIMNKSRTTTTNEEIKIPYRNGILHGRDLNFANQEVASKCWWALACLLEWADEKLLNKKPKPVKPFQAVLKHYQETQELSKRIDSWCKRPIQSEQYWKEKNLETISSDFPEYILLSFLSAWQAGHWGKLSPFLIHGIGKNLGKFTKEVKADYCKFKIINFYLIASNDETPSSTKILTFIEFMKDEEVNNVEIDIILNYLDSNNGSPKLRGEQKGQWYILQLSLRDILFN